MSGAIRSRLFYPPAARARGAKGVVGVAFTIGASGAVDFFRDHPFLRRRAISTRRRARWCNRPISRRRRAARPISRRASTMSPVSAPAPTKSARARLGRRRRRAAVELRLPGVPPRLERRQPREAAHPSGLAVSVDGANWLLLNASIDLRQQILATPALQPKGEGRHSPIAAVVLTNAEVDSSAGLLALARAPAARDLWHAGDSRRDRRQSHVRRRRPRRRPAPHCPARRDRSSRCRASRSNCSRFPARFRCGSRRETSAPTKSAKARSASRWRRRARDSSMRPAAPVLRRISTPASPKPTCCSSTARCSPTTK